MMWIEVADKIPHPSVVGMWYAGVVVAVSVVGLGWFTKRSRPAWVVALAWMIGAGLWGVSWLWEPRHAPGADFVAEMGRAYWSGVMMSGCLPVVVLLAVMGVGRWRARSVRVSAFVQEAATTRAET